MHTIYLKGYQASELKVINQIPNAREIMCGGYEYFLQACCDINLNCELVDI